MLDERLHADDGVVAPVIAVLLLPVIEAGEKQRTVKAVGELLDPAVKCLAIHDPRRRLDDAHGGVFSHQHDQPHQGLAGHQTVGVEHDHVPVVPSPPSEEVGDIATLAVDGLAPFAIKNAAEPAYLFAQLHPGNLLLNPLVRLVGIAENEEVEVLEPVRFLQGTIDDAQALEDAAHVFVIHGDNDRRARQRRFRGARLVDGVADAARISATVDDEEADDRRAEPGRDMREQDDKQEQQRHIQAVEPGAPKEVGHEPGGKAREDEDAREKHHSPPGNAALVQLVGGENLHASGQDLVTAWRRRCWPGRRQTTTTAPRPAAAAIFQNVPPFPPPPP